MQLLIDTLHSFNTQLIQDPPRPLDPGLFSQYQKKRAAFKHHFCTIPIKSEQIQPIIKTLLQSLKIPTHQWGRYVNSSLTVYDFFVELRRTNKKDKKDKKDKNKESEKVNEMIELMNQAIWYKWKRFLIGCLVALGILNVLVPAIGALGGFTLLQDLFAQALFVPIIGLLFTVGICLYSFYQNHTDKRKLLMHRIRDNLFLLAELAFKVAASSILIASAVSMTPVTSILLAVAAIIKIINGIVHLSMHSCKKNNEIDSDDLMTQQQQSREYFDHIKIRNEVLINIGSAIVLAVVIGVWSFMPGGILVSIVAGILIGLISLATMLIQKRNETVINARLERKFVELENKYLEMQPLIPKPSIEPGAANSEVLQDALIVSPEIEPGSHAVVNCENDPQRFAASFPSQNGVFAMSSVPLPMPNLTTVDAIPRCGESDTSLSF